MIVDVETLLGATAILIEFISTVVMLIVID